MYSHEKLTNKCPIFLFFSCRKRFRVNSEDDVNLVHREHPIGKQTKSVQVYSKLNNLIITLILGPI
jgi:hypothetical protein